MSTDTFVRIRDCLRLTGLSRSQLYRLLNLREFPLPVKLGDRHCMVIC
jgi:predicted DNA-binding transcriptional regulator AlpA